MARRQLRAYLSPPFRAEEFVYYTASGTISPGAGLSGQVNFNGQLTVPQGWRGVVVAANLLMRPRDDLFGAGGGFLGVDYAGDNVLTLSRNGTPVPGWLARPATVVTMTECILAASAGAIDDFGDIVGSNIDPDLLVPIKLRAGDRMDYRSVFNDNSGMGLRVFHALLIQGWLYPATDESESGAGNLSDPADA